MLANIGDALAYPWRSGSRWSFVGGAVLLDAVACVQFLWRFAFGWLVVCWILWYLGVFLMRVVSTSADGSDVAPEWPDPADLARLDGGLANLLFLAFALLPELGWLLLEIKHPWWTATLAVVSVVYFPMALLAVIMFRSVEALSPAFIVRSIARVPGQYAVLVVAVAALLGLNLGATYLAQKLNPLAAVFVGPPVMLYFYMVLARLLGLLFCDYREQLEWEPL